MKERAKSRADRLRRFPATAARAGGRRPPLPHLPVQTPCLAAFERLPWVAGRVYLAHGVRIGIRVSDPSVLPLVENLLPPGSRPARGSRARHLVSWLVAGRRHRRRHHVLYAAGKRLLMTRSRALLLEAMRRHLEDAVAELAPRRTFVHAGVVAIGRRVIVLPGRSGAGKTTLVRELLRAGARLYSDEYAVLDHRGRVHPFPRRLRVHGRAGTRWVDAGRLGTEVGGRPLRAAVVIATRYQDGARWRPQPVGPGRVFLELVAQTVHVRYRPRQAVPALRALACAAEGIASPRGEAREVAAWLMARLGRQAA